MHLLTNDLRASSAYWREKKACTAACLLIALLLVACLGGCQVAEETVSSGEPSVAPSAGATIPVEPTAPSDPTESNTPTELLPLSYSGMFLLAEYQPWLRRFYSPNGEQYTEMEVLYPYEFATYLRGDVFFQGEALERSRGGSPVWLDNSRFIVGQAIYNTSTASYEPLPLPDDLQKSPEPAELYCALANPHQQCVAYLYHRALSATTLDRQNGIDLYLHYPQTDTWRKVLSYEGIYGAASDRTNMLWTDSGILFFSLAIGGGDGPLYQAIYRYDRVRQELSLFSEQETFFAYQHLDANFVVAGTRVVDFNREVEICRLPFYPQYGCADEQHPQLFTAWYGENQLVTLDLSSGAIVSRYNAGVFGESRGAGRVGYNAPYMTTLIHPEDFRGRGDQRGALYALVPDIFDPDYSQPLEAKVKPGSISLLSAPQADAEVGQEVGSKEIQVFGRTFAASEFQGEEAPYYLVKTDDQEIGWLHGSLLELVPGSDALLPIADPSQPLTKNHIQYSHDINVRGHTITSAFTKDWRWLYYLDGDDEPMFDAARLGIVPQIGDYARGLGSDELMLNLQVCYNIQSNSITVLKPEEMADAELVYAT
ncbi:MAG: hypothetical protein FWE76_07380, partial [Symbiobacteriaceae bacterium]|nr:hypothetical protein [Symbiobacteriaceae bacterium]